MNNSKTYLAVELVSSFLVSSSCFNLFSLSDKIMVYVSVWQQCDNRLSQPNGHSCIRLWKLIEENLTKMESRGQKVIFLCRYLSTSAQIPKETAFLTESDTPLYYCQQEEKLFSPWPSTAQPWETVITLPMESCSHIWLFESLRTIAFQSPLSVALSKQEHWNGLAFPSPGNFPDRGI